MYVHADELERAKTKIRGILEQIKNGCKILDKMNNKCYNVFLKIQKVNPMFFQNEVTF